MVNLLQISLVGLFSIATPLAAVTSGDIGEIPDARQVPKMITMNYYGDTSSQMAFRWNTDYKTDSVLQIIPSSIHDFSSADVQEFIGSAERGKVAGDGFLHSALAQGLRADTQYDYRIGDKELGYWSKTGSFTTAGHHEATSFIHISDPQVFEEVHSEQYNELLEVATATSEPEFVCLTGDIVNNSWANSTPILEQWNWALSDQADVLQNIPVMPVSGNHDAADYDFTSRYYLPTPANAETKSGVYYSYDYNNIHFIALNTNDSSADTNNLQGLSNAQMDWLQADLKSARKAAWTVVMMHKGIFDAGGHSSNIDGEDGDIALIRAQLSPLFTKYGVDIVLQGHDHLYSRSYPLKGGEGASVSTNDEQKVSKTHDDLIYQLYENPQGPIYLNSGSASGSKYYNVVGYDETQIPLEKTHGSTERMYTSFYIANNELYANVYEVINGEAILYDTFGIVKTHEDNKTMIIVLVTIGGLVLLALGGTLAYVIWKKKGVKQHG